MQSVGFNQFVLAGKCQVVRNVYLIAFFKCRLIGEKKDFCKTTVLASGLYVIGSIFRKGDRL